VKQLDLANWAAAPIKGKAGKVALKKVTAADAPVRCQAAAESAKAPAFSIATTPMGVPSFCFVFSSRPTKQCGLPADKKLAPCKLKSLGAYILQE
jgi:hypothetical protein